MRLRLLAGAIMLLLGAERTLAQEWRVPARSDRLGLQEGLSQSTVTCVLQDSMGFLWVGTEDGLNRYDGYRFTVFKPRPGDPHGLSSSQVWALHESRDGTLWVGTYGGLSRFDRASETFTTFVHDPSDPGSLSSNFVRAVHEDREGVIWVGTKDGLNQMVHTSQGIAFKPFRHDPRSPASLSDSYTRVILEDRAGHLWVGTNGGGLNRLDRARGTFEHFRHRQGDPSSLSADDVLALCEGAAGTLFVGTNTGGLCELDPDSGRVARYPLVPPAPGAFGSPSVAALCPAGEGHLWVGTSDDGLSRLDSRTGDVLTLRHDQDDPTSLSADRVRSLFVDRSALVWVGTTSGLNKLDPKRVRFERYSARRGDDAEAGSVRALIEDRHGTIWVGTRAGLRRLEDGVIEPVPPRLVVQSHVRAVIEDRHGMIWLGSDDGVSVIDEARQRVTPIRLEIDGSTRPVTERVWTLIQDHEGTIWIGTESGLIEVKDAVGPTTGGLKRGRRQLGAPGVPGRLQSSFVRTLYEDRDGSLWAGTQDAGLFRLDRATGNWDAFLHDPAEPTSLDYPVVACVLQDRSGVLWVGTYGGGLNRLEPRSRRFTHITEADGLPNNVIYGILEDNRGCLWLSSNGGLTRFDPAGQPGSQIRNFSTRDGLQSLEFNTGAYCTLRDGRLLFGGIEGINAFRPELLLDDPVPPAVAITGFRVANREVLPGQAVNGRVLLHQAISQARRIDLSHAERVLTFEFAGLHFAAPERNRYAYRMEGLDETWSPASSQRFATYAQLLPGRYVFHVRAANPDGIWSEKDASIEVTVRPPIWGTWWFRLALAALLLAVVVAVHRTRTRAIRRRASELEALNRDLHEQMAERARVELEKDRLVAELRRLHAELADAYDTTLEGWARILEMRDQDTEGHTRRVTKAADRLAVALGLSESERIHIRRGAILHDIGKIALPDTLLRQREPLTAQDRKVISEHPELARRFLESVDFLKRAIDIPYCHHERWDGRGYPRGLAGEDIPLAARLFAVVDVWDALSSDRPYRRAWSPSAVRAYIHDHAGTHFDPRMVEAFLDLLDRGLATGERKAS